MRCSLCILQLYWVCSLVLALFLWNLPGFLYVRSGHLQVILPILFLFGNLLFLFLTWVLWLGLLVLCWIEMGRAPIFALYLIVEGKFQFFTTEYEISCDLFIHCFIILRYNLLVFLVYWMFLITTVILDFVKCFLCINWDDHGVFVLYSLKVVYCIDWFYMEPSLYSRNKSYFVMISNHFTVLLN